jgi:UTP--glucose-1-phosphate uridylyltransferase
MPTSTVIIDTAPQLAVAASDTIRPTVAVVPVAGHGTRLRPLSPFIPKELLPVGGRLALWRIVDELYQAGIRCVIFVVSPEKRAFVEKCFSNSSVADDRLNVGPFSGTLLSSIRFEYIVQPTMRGLGDAILCAREAVGGRPFVVALGDAVYEEPAPGGLTRRLIEAFVTREVDIALAVQPVVREHVSRYGVVQPMLQDSDEQSGVIAINDIVEKPSPADAPSNLAAAARYVVRPDVFRVLEQTVPDARGEVQFTHALRTILNTGKTGIALPLRQEEIRHDIGSMELYYRAFTIFALNDPELGATYRRFLHQRLQESILPAEENGRGEPSLD